MGVAERGISKLALRPVAGDVGIVKKFEDRLVWLIVLWGNRASPVVLGCAGSSLRPPFAKPRLWDPVPNAATVRGGNVDCGLGGTELDDSSCSGEKLATTNAG